jgi:hypothetical protein
VAIFGFRKRARTGRTEPPHDVVIDRFADLAPYRYWVEGKAPIRFLLPPAALTMQGAFNYASARHPFRRALASGRESLAAFYAAHQPDGLAEMYGLPPGETGSDLEPWRLPWIGWVRPEPPGAEYGLSPAEGVSFYGPVTSRKLDLEMTRLTRLADAIRRDGYRSDLHGDIAGLFLVNGDRIRFFVRGGKHRAAVLAWLHPQQRIPVTCKPGWPRMVDRADVANWPMVHSGTVCKSLALKIFDRYFDAPAAD